MNLLFICKYNRYRSKIAEALFKKYNKNKGIKVKSAGIQTDFLNPYVAESVKKEMEERGANITESYSIPINNVLVKWADKVIIVADDVENDNFPEEKIFERWEIEDASQYDEKAIEKGANQIEAKVLKLIKRLEKENFG